MSKADRLLAEAHALYNRGELRRALDVCGQAAQDDPDQPESLRLMATLLEQLEEYEKLTELLDRSVARWPQNDDLWMSRSRVYASLGNFEVALAGYLAVLGNTPGHIDAVCALVQSGEEASAGGMDIRAKQRAAVTVIRDLNPGVIERFRGNGHPSDRPVFIVGMPRSGTSLTEQVLSRHPGIYSIGEQTFLGEVLRDLINLAPKEKNVPLAESIDGMAANIWRRVGGKYLRRLDEIDAGSERITDKLPANFALLPWIQLLLPGARVIHVRRHPLATLASCIRTPFADPLLSFSLEDWGRFYGLYEAMMDQWRPMMGARMLEVEYENLVGNLPAETRRMLDFLQLDWDEDCLHPERAQRAVRTASWKQVRHGVHTDSVDKWRCYETQLKIIEPFVRQSHEEIASQTVEGPRRA